ncbi:MAG: hypothetical protein EOP10_12240 [Proteobacteria bacterium]|nr:MAG: hypothetical protein EOP10_12240 [Pseudomonadota bacterium]
MGKSKKTKDYRKDSRPVPETIRFEIEENAAQLMEEHLALFKPSPKDADTSPRPDHSKRVASRIIEIDLHGLTVEEAERRVIELTSLFPFDGEARTYKVITGKGRHSSGGQGVLIREIYLFVKARFGLHIVTIEESPDAVRIGGVALRGHFHVTLKGP